MKIVDLRAHGIVVVGQRTRDALARPHHALAAMGHRVVFFERTSLLRSIRATCSNCPAGTRVSTETGTESGAGQRANMADAEVAIVTSFCPDGIDATEARPRCAARPSPSSTISILPSRCPGWAGEEVVATSARAACAILTSCSAIPAARRSMTPKQPRRVACRAALRPCRSEVHTSHPARCRNSLPTCPISAPIRRTGSRRRGIFRGARPAQRQRTLRSAGAQYPRISPGPRTSISSGICRRPIIRRSSASSRLTLNVTRHAMAEMGWCPSAGSSRRPPAGRRFVRLVGRAGRILRTRAGDPGRWRHTGWLDAIERSPDDYRAHRAAARDRTLAEHTSARRARQIDRPAGRGGATKPPWPPWNWRLEHVGDRARSRTGSRIQPLAFSKELLPVGSRLDGLENGPAP